MELCDGDLKDILNKYKPKGLPLNLIKKIFIQLNEALKTMREKGINNKDLKPENILIKYSDNNKTNFDIKLNNFGLSNNESTINNFIKLNTKDYTSPEIDKKIIYELCTNRYIFDADNPKDREKIIELMEKLVKKQVMKWLII